MRDRPNITRKGESPPDAEKWKDVSGKYDAHFSPNPGNTED